MFSLLSLIGKVSLRVKHTQSKFHLTHISGSSGLTHLTADSAGAHKRLGRSFYGYSAWVSLSRKD